MIFGVYGILLTRCKKVYKNVYYMVTITKEKFINVFRERSITLFTWNDFLEVFDIRPETAKAFLNRLKKGRIIQSLVRGKYVFLLSRKQAGDYEIANFIYTPSYISLESALSVYGIINQFPYQVTSISLKRKKEFKIKSKVFTFSQIKDDFYKDYQKEGEYLIATPQKAVFDFLYLVYKGSRSRKNLDLLQLGGAGLNKKSLANYVVKTSKDEKFIKFCKEQKII